MDRLYRTLAGCSLSLTLVLPNAGCKSTAPEVPPSPAFSGNGQSQAPGFNSAPNPIDGAANFPPQGNSQYGIPNPASTPSYGPAGNGGFGAPGTNVGTPSAAPTMTAPDAGRLSSPGGTSNPMTGLPQTGTGPTGPASGIGAAPTQNPFDR